MEIVVSINEKSNPSQSSLRATPSLSRGRAAIHFDHHCEPKAKQSRVSALWIAEPVPSPSTALRINSAKDRLTPRND